ncbi:MAG: EAL domain-containing protein [Eggerthellaceae bacterium]|nr:EAL domain-containing protein [Eggerthellaceae bacterium]
MKHAQDELSKRGARRKILVVEDNDLNREMLCAVLQQKFDTIEATDGIAGLEALDEHRTELSLVLLDVYMPRCDGFEFLRRMRADERFDTLPVIVATASDSVDDELECLKLGANDFVLKPYKSEIIMNRVSNMISLRESASLVNDLTWDDTTGLYSKELFYRTVEDILETNPNTEYDLVCSDIDGFSVLSDRYGTEKCDELLRALADQLRDKLPGYVVGGRIGADVFAFLADHRPSWPAEGPQNALGDLPVPNVSVKFGIVERIDRAMTVSKACNRAMRALETVKGRHGLLIALYDDDLHQRQELEQTIRETMEKALEDLQFAVFYQPKHDVSTGKTGGAEALVRWTHPEIGFVSPGLFIPIFERNGFITKLDMFVWEEACKEIKRCEELGLPAIPISVNASRLDFDVPDLPARICAIADKHGVDHALLHVELTESAYAENPDAVVRMLNELKGLGFSTELDDFGAGYSSLVSLNTLPLDVMKLDMSMVRQATATGDFRIVESTIKLAQVLGLKTVVEGVETAEEARRVTEMGCDLIQGYYYSRPLSKDDFEEYLRDNANEQQDVPDTH